MRSSLDGGIAQLGERLHGMQEVSGSIPLTSTKQSCIGSPSSRGLGHRPFTAITGVRIPVGTPVFRVLFVEQISCGVVVQLVRIPACHAGGRGFESRPLRQGFEVKAVAAALTYRFKVAPLVPIV